MNYEKIKIKIDGINLPAPTTFSINLEDLDSGESLRDVKKGVLSRLRVRNDVLKISLGYSMEDLTTISKIINMVKPVSFNVETLDIHTLERKTFKMYCSKKKYQYIVVGKGIYAKGLAIDITEC